MNKKWSYTVTNGPTYGYGYVYHEYEKSYTSGDFSNFRDCYRSYIKYIDNIDEDDSLNCKILYTNYKGTTYKTDINRDGTIYCYNLMEEVGVTSDEFFNTIKNLPTRIQKPSRYDWD